MSRSKWRKGCTPIIKQVLIDTKGLSEKEINKALCDAYPFGKKQYYPYRIWRDEIKIQLGLKEPLPKKEIENPNQLTLF